MKYLLRFGFLTFAVSCLMLTTSCDDNDSLLTDIDDGTFKADTILLEEGALDVSQTVFVSDLEEAATSFNVPIKFKSADKKMRRVYMTENNAGAGALPYELLLEDLDKKGDGSLDIESKQGSEFTFHIPFNVLPDLSEGTVEYQIWATSGKGDYRDTEVNQVTCVGTLVVDYGGTNPETVINEYSAKLFAVPLADGSSETFISVLNGDLYKLSEGAEYASFWDFGYYWLNTPGASLASTSSYPKLFDHDTDASTGLVAIAELTDTPQEELNHCYFAASDKTSADFDAITNSNQLSDLTVPTTSEKVNNLTEGDIVMFMDNYGKKGLIRVTAITSGYGTDGSMTIDIKVQP